MAAGVHRRDRTKGLLSDIEAAHISIPKFCPVLGIPLIASFDKHNPGSPSIDHIDPGQGAVWGTWKVISYRANALKKGYTVQTLSQYIEQIEHPARYPGKRRAALRGNSDARRVLSSA